MDRSRFLKKLPEPKCGEIDPRLDDLRDYCLAKPGATEEYPFGPEVMVIKVGGKIFAIVAWEEAPVQVSLKCDPERIPGLREQFAAIEPPRYLNKQHWNVVTADQRIDEALLHELVDHSYDLIWNSLTRKTRAGIE